MSAREPHRSRDPSRGFAPLLLAALALVVSSLGSASADESQRSETTLRQQLDHIFSDRALQGVKMSLRVLSVTKGRVLYSYHADEVLIPASNVKLATTAAALYHLGEGYEFRTRVGATGPIGPGGVVRGDLVVVGGGDPNISRRFLDGDAAAVFKQWARELRRRGLRVIAGDLIGDDRFFDRQYRHPTWPKGQEAYWYEAPVGGLSLNDNCVDFFLSPTSPGKPARLRLNPPTDYLAFTNRCLTRPGRAAPKPLFQRARGSRQVLIEGSIPHRGGEVLNHVTVDVPGEYFLAVLAQVLRQQGIEVRGRVRLVEPGEAVPPLTTLIEHRSQLLSAVRVANKRSQNFYAEQILKTLGREVLGEGSFERGVEAVTTFLDKRGLDPEGYHLVDGSGMSRENRLSARCITNLLAVMAHSPVAEPYLESLSQAGVDGSLRSRLREPEYAGKVFAKTGTLTGVRALSGYARTQRGELLAYSFLMNGRSAGTGRARSLQDEALRLLVGY